jgi:hypothetical protein
VNHSDPPKEDLTLTKVPLDVSQFGPGDLDVRMEDEKRIVVSGHHEDGGG